MDNAWDSQLPSLVTQAAHSLGVLSLRVYMTQETHILFQGTHELFHLVCEREALDQLCLLSLSLLQEHTGQQLWHWHSLLHQ